MALLDADDVARPDRLGKQVRFMDSQPVDAVGGAVRLNGATTKVWPPPTDQATVRRYAMSHKPFPTTALMLHRHVVEELGGFREAPFRDYDFDVRAVHRFTGANLGDVVVDVQMDRSGIMSRRMSLSRQIRMRWRASGLVSWPIRPFVFLAASIWVIVERLLGWRHDA